MQNWTPTNTSISEPKNDTYRKIRTVIMNTKIAAFIIVGASVYGITKIISSYRKDDISTRIMFLWILLWSGIGVFALFPSMLDAIMKLVNMGDRLFFLTTWAILILFVIVFYVTSNISKSNRKISKLTQEIALLKYQQKAGKTRTCNDEEA